MQTAQGNMLVSLNAVDEFLTDHAAALGGVITTGARGKLKQAIADLIALRSDQTGGVLTSRISTQSKASLRKALMRDHMAPLARIAKSELAQTPQMLPLRMPRGRPTIPKLVAAAEGMAKAAAPYASVFTENGMPADFVDQLNASAATLMASASTHTNIQGRRKTATKGVQARLSAGRRIVHVLDSYVQTALKDDGLLMAAWNTVKHVQRVGAHATAIAAAPSPVPPAPVPPAPVPGAA